jgi:hypothetical protein
MPILKRFLRQAPRSCILARRCRSLRFICGLATDLGLGASRLRLDASRDGGLAFLRCSRAHGTLRDGAVAETSGATGRCGRSKTPRPLRRRGRGDKGPRAPGARGLICDPGTAAGEGLIRHALPLIRQAGPSGAMAPPFDVGAVRPKDDAAREALNGAEEIAPAHPKTARVRTAGTVTVGPGSPCRAPRPSCPRRPRVPAFQPCGCRWRSPGAGLGYPDSETVAVGQLLRGIPATLTFRSGSPPSLPLSRRTID